MNPDWYFNLHKIDTLRKLDQEESDPDPQLAYFLHKNLNQMEFEEQWPFLKKILTARQVQKLLIEYEFYHLPVNPTKLSLTQTVNQANKLIHRYQWRSGGYQLGDSNWDCHTKPTKMFQIPSNEIWMTNTVSISNYEQEEKYLNRLTELLNNLSTEITVSLKKVKYHRDATYLLMLIFSDGTQMDEDLIGL